VVATVADPYREPPCPWCAGNRGIEYRLAGDVVIRVAASGRVVFSGTVAGDHYVVVQLANGWRHTYGHLTSPTVGVGDTVLAGGDIGRASDVLFFGLRIGDDYRDPAPFLGVERRRARLVPLDGSPPRPAPSPRLQCPQLGTAR
jgi:murein DD-endopeptidase MepM/ murein hydrolase activator NlpD